MEDDVAIYTGACLCGVITFVATGRPQNIAVCHCKSCRRHTGAPFAVYADYQARQVAWAGEPPKDFDSSPGVRRGFCDACGSTLYYKGDNLPDMIHIHVGAFAEPELFEPVAHENCAERLAWVDERPCNQS